MDVCGGFGSHPGGVGVGSRLTGSTRSPPSPLTRAPAGSGIPERAGRGLEAKANRRFKPQIL